LFALSGGWIARATTGGLAIYQAVPNFDFDLGGVRPFLAGDPMTLVNAFAAVMALKLSRLEGFSARDGTSSPAVWEVRAVAAACLGRLRCFSVPRFS